MEKRECIKCEYCGILEDVCNDKVGLMCLCLQRHSITTLAHGEVCNFWKAGVDK